MLPVFSRRPVLLAAMLVATSVAVAAAQQPAAPLPGSAAFAPDSGAVAPDFTLSGATRFGLLKDPVRLSDYRGQTVVIAFFPKARTKG
jgi:peroxiredoxin Q/BCP